MTRDVVAGVIVQEGHILVTQRKRGDSMGLKWEFPGGKLDDGESLEQGLIRELREELGIEAEIGARIFCTEHQYPGRYPTRLHFFTVTGYSGTIENLYAEQFQWAPPEELLDFDWLEADLEFVGMISQGEFPQLNAGT